MRDAALILVALLAAATTPELTCGEQKWFADHLSEGTYTSADEVLTTLKP